MQEPRTRIVLHAYLRQKGVCPYCQGAVDPTNATWEHVIPRAWGGIDNHTNVILACERCNSAKSAIESHICNTMGRELDLGSRGALFVMRCMKLRRRKKKRKLPGDAYVRMAVSMQEAVDAWLRQGRVAIPEIPPNIRGMYF